MSRPVSRLQSKPACKENLSIYLSFFIPQPAVFLDWMRLRQFQFNLDLHCWAKMYWQVPAVL